MAEIVSYAQRHRWLEVLSGGSSVQAQNYVCVKRGCGVRASKSWKDSPDNQTCFGVESADDRFILKRQPSPSVSIERPMIPVVTDAPAMPCYLQAVREPGNRVSPIVFHPQRPGFVLTEDANETLRVRRLLAELGLSGHRQDNFEQVIIRSREQFDDLVRYADACDMKLHGVYGRLMGAADGIRFHFWPFRDAPKLVTA